MAINLERAAMKGKLATAKESRMRLTNKFEGLASAIRHGINTALIDIKDVEIMQLSQMWGDLETVWIGISELNLEIERLEKEIGD